MARELQQPLFEGIPERSLAELAQTRRGKTILDSKGRTVRHRPWWELIGKGPEEYRCVNCEFLVREQSRSGRNFYKCGMQAISRGPGTDILRKDAACRLFELKKGTL